MGIGFSLPQPAPAKTSTVLIVSRSLAAGYRRLALRLPTGEVADLAEKFRLSCMCNLFHLSYKATFEIHRLPARWAVNRVRYSRMS
jgi:hypothetical protein